jgi:hypothetical protein
MKGFSKDVGRRLRLGYAAQCGHPALLLKILAAKLKVYLKAQA